jgi:hypothetical protein
MDQNLPKPLVYKSPKNKAKIIMAGKSTTRLSQEQEQVIFDKVLEGSKLIDISKLIGFSRYEFVTYRKNFPEFNDKLEAARNDYCDYLEDMLLDLPTRYDSDTAKQLSTNIMKILEYRNPKRYSPKFQHDIQVTVDISGSLDRAERRVLESNISNVIAIDSARSIKNDDDAS